MAILKYFDRVQALLQADRAAAPGPLPPFDFESLGSKSAIARALTRFLLRRSLPALAFILRQIWPNPRFGRVILVTRAADVEQVLLDASSFRVVYGDEMRDLGGGGANVLSVDGAAHDAHRAVLEQIIRPENLELVSQWVTEDAAALLAAGGGRIDAMRDLVTRTAAEAACRLFGLTAHDPDAFGEWTMAVSTQLFGDFTGDANLHAQAKIGSAHLCGLIDDAIARVRFNDAEHPHGRRPHDTLVDRLLTDKKVAPEQVRATIIGLATAFVPTNTLAAGNIFEVLLDRRELWNAASAAADAADRPAMRAVLLEAGRLNPALSPGLWRHVPPDVAPPRIGQGWRARQTRHGDLVLACIPSALRDGRATEGSGPSPRAWMMFGAGPHMCWGAELALAHLTSVFVALFRQPGLGRVAGKDGKIQRIGAFPVRLDLRYASAEAKRAMILAALPVRTGIARSTVEAMLDALGNPARADVAATLGKGNRIQFASLSVIERAPGAAESVLLLEVSGDGDEDDLLGLVAEQGFDWLAPIVALCRPAEHGVASRAALATILRDAYFALDRNPFGNTGLHFDGMAELSVADISRQEKVAAFARHVIDRRLKSDLGLNTRAMGLLLHTRRLIRGDRFLSLRKRDRSLQKLAVRLGLRGAALRPRRKRLSIADWRPPTSWRPGIGAMAAAPGNRFIPGTGLTLLALWWAGLLMWWAPALSNVGERLAAELITLLAGAFLTAVTIAIPIGFLIWRLRRAEQRDAVDERTAGLDHLRAIAERENAPGHVQNHIIAVMPFKPGLLRRLTFALAMWGILQTVRFFFRPGFVVTMGTIHKARWLRVPGTDQFVFLSNYDGSWESYLEDFITRAHPGQTAAWSHGVGFPKTRFLVLDGASDGDRFKRWVRLQQRETRFWYTRFPHLTAQQIRNNAMIEDGLARATSDTDARRWLASFGSAQREPLELETAEAQSLIFSGLPRLREATALLLRLPHDGPAAGAWLSAVSGLSPRPLVALIGPPKRWVHHDEKTGDHIRLPPDARILFGDQSWGGGGAALGLTAEGLAQCGLGPAGGLHSFPAVFRMTMSGRARLLGDSDGAPEQWRFSDGAGLDNEAHAILVLYGHERDGAHRDLVVGHKALLDHFQGTVVHEIPLEMAADADGKPSLHVEPFGFRDGISQPVISGSRRAADRKAPGDAVAAGEILLGYRNHQGYLPLTITVGAERDPACELPTVSAADTNRFPWYGNRTDAYEPRDFGRNGSFLAVRQLDQDVASFWTQVRGLSDRIRLDYPHLAELPGQAVSPEWVAARIIGRWTNGSPLVGNPNEPSRDHDEMVANDFAYGVDDPRGLACPLGAHIRRTNPRDSQEPGDADELRITNRHRLLRRGRAYRYPAAATGAPDQRGLLFMALCGDLERQFEFVQRTWINSTVFHGLVDEHDPLLGPGSAAKDHARGHFTIPTVAGPVRLRGLRPCVAVRGGGYFFVPSRSALAHLITRSHA